LNPVTRRSGWTLLAIGLLTNRFALGAIAAPDGRIDSAPVNALILTVQLALVSAGVFLLRRNTSARIRSARSSRAAWLLLAGSTLLCVIAAEGAARLFREFTPAPPLFPGERANRPSANFVVDAEVGWRMRPGHSFRWRIEQSNLYVSDEDGYRTWEEIEPRREFSRSERRIVLIGDSFTFGTGVDYGETYGALLESRRTAVKNLAMPGFGIDQMWLTLDRRAIALDPNLVIVAFIDDDFDRSLTAYRPIEGLNKPTFVLDGGLRAMAASDRPSPPLRLLQERSWLWSAGRSLTRTLAYQLPIGDWYTLNRELLRAMVARCRGANVALLVVRLPQRSPKPFLTLAREMRSLGASYLDLSSAPPPFPIHFATDDHIDARGHRWVAERLRKSLPE
jgi:hypothetical protein